MFNFKMRPYNLLLVTAVVIFIASLFTNGQSFDLHLHDTYFILSTATLFWVLDLILLFIWAVYALTYRFLFSKALAWIHILLGSASSLFLVAVSFYSNNFYENAGGMPRRYFEYSSWNNFEWHNYYSKGSMVVVLLMGLGILVYLINLAVGLSKKINR